MGGVAPQLGFPLGGDGAPDGGAVEGTGRGLYGRDLLFTDDLQVAANRDYATVEGIENLRQSIRRRLIVRPGEFRLRPEYGVGMASYVKKPLTRSVIDELQRRIVDNLSQDKRIDRVLAIDVTPDIFGGYPGLRVTVRVQALGRELRFEPFDFHRGQA